MTLSIQSLMLGVKMARYKLTNAADKDFENIFNFGIDTFGLTQSINYQLGMVKKFEKLAEQPKHYQSVDHICSGYCRSVYHSHSIFYTIETTSILIVRILGQQDSYKKLLEFSKLK